MLLEISARWPFVRRHKCLAVGASKHGTPNHAHKSWVLTERGRGWIHHHEPDGYVVEFSDGRLEKLAITRNLDSEHAK